MEKKINNEKNYGHNFKSLCNLYIGKILHLELQIIIPLQNILFMYFYACC